MAYSTSRTSPSRKVRFSSHALDFCWNFPPRPIFEEDGALVRLQDDLPFAPLPMVPRGCIRNCQSEPRHGVKRRKGCWRRGSAQRRCIALWAPRCVVGAAVLAGCRFPRLPPAGEPHRRPNDVEAPGQRLRKNIGLIVPIKISMFMGTTNGHDGNRALPRAARATHAE
jgi:hypothetical protein